MNGKRIFNFGVSFILLGTWCNALWINYFEHLDNIPQFTIFHYVAFGLWIIGVASWIFLLYHRLRNRKACCVHCLLGTNKRCDFEPDED